MIHVTIAVLEEIFWHQNHVFFSVAEFAIAWKCKRSNICERWLHLAAAVWEPRCSSCDGLKLNKCWWWRKPNKIWTELYEISSKRSVIQLTIQNKKNSRFWLLTIPRPIYCSPSVVTIYFKTQCRYLLPPSQITIHFNLSRYIAFAWERGLLSIKTPSSPRLTDGQGAKDYLLSFRTLRSG